MTIDMKLLAAQPFLKGLSKQQVDLLSNNAMEVEFPAGKIIFDEGSAANRFYLILTGEVALESAGNKKNGGPTLIQTIKSGDVVGWSWLFPPYKWNFDARAVKPTKAIIFFAVNLRRQCENDPKLGLELMTRVAKVVITRLQATRQQLLKQKKTAAKAA
jgi:CRP-like cAMP-binding protein